MPRTTLGGLRLSLLLSLYFFFRLPTSAQESVDTIYTFDQDITVSATTARRETPVTFVDLTEKDIAVRNLGQDAPYLLKWTPSVVVTSDAGTGIGYTGIWIRGSDPTRTNVTINGIPYNDSESQGVFWVNLPDFSSSADLIQIQRGVGTSTNGAGAFGATIDFTTSRGRNEDTKLSFDGGIGSFGTRRGRVVYEGKTEDGLGVAVRYSKTHSNGYIDRARADLDGYYAAVSKDIGKSLLSFVAFGGHEVTYQAWFGVTQDQIDAFGRTYNPAGTEREGEPYENEVDNYRQNHYQLHWDYLLDDDTELSVKGHYTRGLGFFEQYKADQALAEYNISPPAGGLGEESDLIRRLWLDNHFYGTVYSLRHRRGAWDLTVGGAANEYRGDHYGEVIWARLAGDSELGDRYYENDATKRDFSNYLRANYAATRRLNLYADAQLRYVDYRFEGDGRLFDRIDQQVDHTFFNPKAGVVYTPDDDSRVYASFAVARREPNRNDFVNNPVNTRPRPERLLNTEIGFHRTRDRAQYGLNVYHMAYRDQLVVTGELNDVGELVRTNVPRSYRLGIELQGAAGLTDDLTLGGNATLSRNRSGAFTELLDDFEADGETYRGRIAVERDGTPLAYSPDLTAAAQLVYERSLNDDHALEAALETKYVGPRYVDNSGAEASRLPGYYYSDLRLNYTFRQRYGLSFMLRNLTDQLYFSNGWGYRYRAGGEVTTLRGVYPQAGRNLLVSLRVRL